MSEFLDWESPSLQRGEDVKQAEFDLARKFQAPSLGDRVKKFFGLR